MVTAATEDIVDVPNGAKIKKEEPDSSSGSTQDQIRPLHQNWWPVSITPALDNTRPNAIELLGMRLVLFYDEAGDEWKCLEDMCSHRFAPLSEGRVIQASTSKSGSGETTSSSSGSSTDNDKCVGKSCTIQCAYHGWEFDTNGSCTRIPQQEEGKPQGKVASVPSFPVQLDVGIIWVWADPETAVFSQAVPLPISPLLRRAHKARGDNLFFMRDLPYGIELLGENLLDLSHLPFSHHSVGALSREKGGPLPLRMLSKKEKQEEMKLECEESLVEETGVLPMFQVEVVNASIYDPIPIGTCTINFYDPCHVKYRRTNIEKSASSHTELFMSPTKAGQSRVFLAGPSTAFLPPVNPPEKTTKSKFSLSELKAKIQKKMVERVLESSMVRIHMLSHQIFDGDGIFLNKQGDRMRRNSLTYKDYSTPTEADMMVNAFRRYLDRAVRVTEEAGHTLASSTIPKLDDDNSKEMDYVDVNDRPKLLDRYESHTAHCQICLKELKKTKAWHTRWDILQTAFIGAAGSCSTAFTAAIGVSLFSAAVPGVIIPASGAASVSTIVGAVFAKRQKKKLDKKIRQFYFEDYVHAEKD